MKWSPLTKTINFVFPLPFLTETLPPHRHTNSYLIGQSEMAMIDAGLWDEEGIKILMDYIEKGEARRLCWLFLTHWHPDHCQGVEKIKEKTGCKVGIHANEVGKIAPFSIDLVLHHGDRFICDDHELEVIHTPGHSSGHCCFFLRSCQVLFTGDHILGEGTSIIVPPDGDMALYIDSLTRLLAFPVEICCPGHGPVVWEAKEKINEYLEHRKERELAVLEAVRAGLNRPGEIVKRVYTDVPESFHALACFSVEAHLVKLEGEGKVRKRLNRQGYEQI